LGVMKHKTFGHDLIKYQGTGAGAEIKKVNFVWKGLGARAK